MAPTTLVLNHWFLWLTWKFSFVKPNIWKSFTSKQTKQKWNDIFIKFSYLSSHINQICLKKEDINDWIRQIPSRILTPKKCNTIINCLKLKTVSTNLFYWDQIMWFRKCLQVAFFFIKFFDEVFRVRLVHVFKNWKLLFKNICGNTCGWKCVWKCVKCCLKTKNDCLKTVTKHPLTSCI